MKGKEAGGSSLYSKEWKKACLQLGLSHVQCLSGKHTNSLKKVRDWVTKLQLQALASLPLCVPDLKEFH